MEQFKQFKREGKSRSPWLDSCNKFHVLANRIIQAGILDKEESKKDRKSILRKKNTKKEEKEKSVDVRKIIETLLDSGATELVISLEFVQK